MARVFYIEETRLVIFTMFSHRKEQTVSVFTVLFIVLFLYTKSYIICYI